MHGTPALVYALARRTSKRSPRGERACSTGFRAAPGDLADLTVERYRNDCVSVRLGCQ